MAIVRNSSELMLVAEVASVGQTGHAHSLAPALNQVSDSDITFYAWCHINMIGGATSPSVTVHMETSINGTHWSAACAPIVFDAAGDVSKLAPIDTLCGYVRVRTVLAGGTPPTYTGNVSIVASHPIRVKRI